MTVVITFPAIVEAVCAHYELRREELLGRRNAIEIVRARHVAMWLARRATDLTLAEIGSRLGGQVHGSVIYGCRRIDEAIGTDDELRHDLEIITACLRAVGSADAIDVRLCVDADPLRLALLICTNARAVYGVSLDDIRSLARCLVGMAIDAGMLTPEGSAAADPTDRTLAATEA
jgi:hypothetical protein